MCLHVYYALYMYNNFGIIINACTQAMIRFAYKATLFTYYEAGVSL